MRSGVIFGNAAMIDGMLSRIEEELGGPATVIATGALQRRCCRSAAITSFMTALCCSKGCSLCMRKINN